MGQIFPSYTVGKVWRICRHFRAWGWLLNSIRAQYKVRTNARQHFEKMDTTTNICVLLSPNNSPISFFRLVPKYSTQWSPQETLWGQGTAPDIVEGDDQKVKILTLWNWLLQPQRHASKAQKMCPTSSLYIKGEVRCIFCAFGTPC